MRPPPGVLRLPASWFLPGLAGALLWPAAGPSPATAAVAVHLNFTADLHDGAGNAASNGTADWIDELNQMTTALGIAAFSPAERAGIEAEILSQVRTVYTGYSVTFDTVPPETTPYDTIYVGYDNDTAEFPAGTLGFAYLDIANIFAGQTANVAPANFGFIIEVDEPRSTQIAELATALAGTAAHELGHTFGLLHHDAYSDPGITPATYGDTGGLQNQYIMATGPTGLDEIGRETLRTFAPWEKAVFDVTGAAADVYTTYANQSLVASPVPLDITEWGTDAGSTLGTALPLSLNAGATSGFDLAFIAGDLEQTTADVDVYSLYVSSPGRLVAEAFSANLPYEEINKFDVAIELLDPSGTVLASNDDLFYYGNLFNAGFKQQEDACLLNIPLAAAGTYYLRVAPSASPDLPAEASVDNVYWLLTGVMLDVVPEPGALSLLALTGALGLAGRRGRGRSRRPAR